MWRSVVGVTAPGLVSVRLLWAGKRRLRVPLRRLVLFLTLIAVCGGSATATTIFSDDFESGAAGSWSVIVGGLTLSMETTPALITDLPFETVNVTTTVELQTAHPGPFTIELEQQITPEGAIEVKPGLPASFVATGSIVKVFTHEVAAQLTGDLEIVSTAAVVGTTESAENHLIFHSLSALPEVTLLAPGSHPTQLAPATSVPVTFTVVVSDFEPTAPPTTVVLEQATAQKPAFGPSRVQTSLNDLGIDGDLAAGDGVWSATTVVSSAGLAVGDCLPFQARSGDEVSPTYELCVGSFPVGGAASDLSDPLVDPQDGGQVVRDEVIVRFVEGTGEAQMQSALASVGGSIVGAMPGIGLVRAVITPQPMTLGGLHAILVTLVARPDVLQALPNPISRTPANRGPAAVRTFDPNDPFDNAQRWLDIVRAREAWVLSRGGPVIGIVDSGIDAAHPDFATKVILGSDLQDEDDDPRDENSHGTSVAGIAAARGNNAQSVAGLSWNSPIYVVKVTDGAHPAAGTMWNQGWGIVEAANQGAKIINTSFGDFGLSEFCLAVDWARQKGALVVGAAGNEGSSDLHYPAACGNAIAVGGTTDGDQRWFDSNFGSWVDLAAPAANVGTTTPTYPVSAPVDPVQDMNRDGTSLSTPIVAGAAALVWARYPWLSVPELVDQLQKTAKKLPGLGLGAGRVDVMEALFNGSFEQDNLFPWRRLGTAASITGLGALRPSDGSRFGFVSSGPAGAQVAGSLDQSLEIQPGVTRIPISFRYAFITEEYPEFVGTQFDDKLFITFTAPGGGVTDLAVESVNVSSLVPIAGIDFEGGDLTVGWTTWKTYSGEVTVSPGTAIFTIEVEDAGDAAYDSAVLIDRIRFQ